MTRNVIISFSLHLLVILIAAMSLPFITKKPIELPPIISVELIQIMDKTNIPYAPKAKKLIRRERERALRFQNNNKDELKEEISTRLKNFEIKQSREN